MVPSSYRAASYAIWLKFVMGEAWKKPLVNMYRYILAILVCVGSLPTAALATDLTRDTDLSVWGGYFSTDAPKIEGYSDGTTVNLPIRNNTRSSPDQGGFFGVSFGTDIELNPLMFNRIEWYFEGQQTERDSNSLTSVGVGSIPFVTGLVAGIGPVPLTAYAERERYEIGARLSDFGNSGIWSNLQITPFGGFGSETAVSTAVHTGFGLSTNKSDLDWRFAGVLAGGEYVLPLANNLDLALEGNVGPYFYDASAKLSGVHNLSSAKETFSESGSGIRANAQVELRKMVSSSLELAVFGGVDFWSSVPYVRLNNPVDWNSTRPSGIGSDQLLDLRAGVKLTLKLGG